MNVFGVGPGEALLVLIIGLLVVGPGRFPELAREAGRWYRIARRYSAEVMSDVRAAVDDLEADVTAPGEDLRSIREIGNEFRDDLRAAGRSVSEIGRETRNAAEVETNRALTATESTAKRIASRPASDAATDAPAGDRAGEVPAEEAVPRAELPEAADQDALTAAEEAPAQPVSIRPSRRTRPGAPVDPFETLAAKRERERTRDADGTES